MPRKSSFPIDHILWAVDISAPNQGLQHAVVGALRALTQSAKVAIEPVHVLSRSEAGVPQEVFDKHAKNFERPVETRFREWASKINLPGLTKPSLIVWKGIYLRSNVDALMRHGRKTGADLIALSTRAREGLPRFWLGSFAETLLLHSTIPLFLVNPRSRIPKRFRHVLFPTDLSKDSRKIFEKVVPIASGLGATIVLHHWLEPYQVMTGVDLPPTTLHGALERERRRSCKEKLEEWAASAKARGIEVEIRLSDKKSSASEAILAEAKRLDSAFIALAAQSSFFKTVLVGSTVRKIARQADCPVWVLHS